MILNLDLIGIKRPVGAPAFFFRNATLGRDIGEMSCRIGMVSGTKVISDLFNHSLSSVVLLG